MLKLKVIHTLPKTAHKAGHCQVILVDKDRQMIANDKLTHQKDRIEKLLNVSHFQGNVADVLMDFDCGHDEQQSHLLLVGVGEIQKLTANGLQKIAQVIYKTLHQHQQTAQIVLHDVLDEQQFAQFALALLNQSYRFDQYKSEKKDHTVLKTVQLLVKDKTWQTIVDFQIAVFTGQSLTKDLANQPPNVCYPAYLAEQAKRLAKAYPDLLTVKVVGEKEMQKLGMNCFLAVSHGSEREGQLILLEYNGTQTGKKAKKSLTNPLVFVGKGVTFDTGGISLKPAANMGEMKYDMSGAASVLGMIKALCEAKLPLQVVGALACAENMPSGRATRPGDIVTAMNGKTVEILNTDAEGRLVLADTLTYVQRYQPKVIIDMATLTGACIVALGHVRSAVYSHDQKLLADLQKASDDAFDRIWHMPLDDDYHEQLSSNMADMQNIGGMPAGSVTAACFLSKFVEKDIPWAHLDIAGTAWKSGKEPSSTGRPVPLLMNYLKQQAENS